MGIGPWRRCHRYHCADHGRDGGRIRKASISVVNGMSAPHQPVGPKARSRSHCGHMALNVETRVRSNVRNWVRTRLLVLTLNLVESLLAAFRQRLTSLGWIEGNNIGLEVRWAEADNERMRAHAVELAQMMPDAIVVHGSKALTAVRRETDRIPIVFASIADPIASGYVASLARPGGNVTGFSIYSGMPSPKLLELLKDVVPGLSRVAFLITPDNPGRRLQFQALGRVARSFGVETMAMFISDPASIMPTIAAFAQKPNSGLVVTSDVFMIAHRRAIVDA